MATTDQISYIHTAIGDGNLDGSGLTKITGSSTAVIAQLANINDKPGADSLAIELTGSSTGSNIITLAGHSYVSGVDGSDLSAITGTTTQVYDAIDDLSATNSSFDVTITDTATADQIATIHEAIGSEGTLTATNVSELSGTPTALLTAVSYFDDIPTAEFVDLTVGGGLNATQITDLKDLDYVNTPFDGSQLSSIDGTATQVKAALDVCCRSNRFYIFNYHLLKLIWRQLMRQQPAILLSLIQSSLNPWRVLH